MNAQIANPFSNTWFTPDYGDFFGNGPEFWLASRCLLGVVAGSAPSDIGPNTVPVAKAYADELWQQLYRPSRFNPQGFRAFHAKKWAAGHLAVPLFKAASADPNKAADTAVEYARTIVGKCGESQISTVFRKSGDSLVYDGYLLTESMRRAVLMFEDWLRDNPA